MKRLALAVAETVAIVSAVIIFGMIMAGAFTLAETIAPTNAEWTE